MSDIRFHDMPDGRRIAFRLTEGKGVEGAGPCLVFLPGYMSDMAGSKATALFDDARQQGRAALLFDYSGCGASSGIFAQGTLSRWRDEALSLIGAYVNVPIVFVGSSMGGWLMLLVGEALGGRLAGMVGIAAAPDFTRWGYSHDQRAQLAAGQTVYEDNPYGPEPTPTHPGFFADAEQHMRLGSEIAIACPVRLLHGQRDTDVPWEVSVELAKGLRSDDIQVTLVKDGDHRLSQDSDLALLKRTVSSLM